MKFIYTRLRTSADPEAGISLIEVMVALMIFAILAVSVAYALLSTLTLTRDARSREVAANLAAQEIDLDRSAKDLFDLGDTATPIPATVVGGVDYYVQRSTHWVTGEGAAAGCGTGPGTLQYKRINVSVTWSGMGASTPAARADTLLAPSDRINDPTLGTIIVSVLTATGAGSAGVTVSATPTAGVSGNTAVAVTGDATDAQGCSYLLKVTPGTYDVTIAHANYVTDQRAASPVTKSNVAVTAGTSAQAGFVFDQAAAFTVTYPVGPVQLPTNLDTTFISTAGTFVFSSIAGTRTLFPASGGYAVMAGHYVAPASVAGDIGCTSIDPGAWPTDATTGAVGTRTFATTSGSTAVPMGVLTVAGASGQYLKAVSATGTGTDDPGCSEPMTYTFPRITSAQTIALPYGSWTLYTGSAHSQTTPVLGPTIGVTAPSSVTLLGVVTLDPRQVVAP